MARHQKTNRAYAMLAILSAAVVGVPGSADPCEEGMNQIWNVEDATSFEAIESQVSTLILNASDAVDASYISFPDEEGC
ncbi:MAG: hypothetical protein ACP5DX_17435 [Paracoccaceae bacterium]